MYSKKQSSSRGRVEILFTWRWGSLTFPPPDVVVDAGIRALREGRTRYTHSLGHPELRETIASSYRKTYGVDVSSSRVIVTVGSSGAMLLAFASLLDPGTEVLMSDPHYACYPNFVSSFGALSVQIRIHEEAGFLLDAEAVRKQVGPQTRALVLNSPANPTGSVPPSDRLAELCRAVEGRAVVVSDEVYHGLVYEGQAHTALEFASDVVVINGFSKLFSMTGWRLGYAIVPSEMVRPMQKLLKAAAKSLCFTTLCQFSGQSEGRDESPQGLPCPEGGGGTRLKLHLDFVEAPGCHPLIW